MDHDREVGSTPTILGSDISLRCVRLSDALSNQSTDVLTVGLIHHLSTTTSNAGTAG